MYIYENHLDGGLYASDHELDHDELYCEQCGDSDWFVGEADTREEAYELLKDDYGYECLIEFLEKWGNEGVKENSHADKLTCNLVSCRYNADGKCENEEKRKECVKVSKLVLCLEDSENVREQ